MQGAGGGTVGVIQAYVADSTDPKDRARALGWLSATTNLGVALGPVLGSFAITLGKRDLLPGAGTLHMGQAAPGILAAALCVLNMVFVARYLNESRDFTEQAPADEPRRTSRQAIWRVISHSSEPASRLIWIYAIAIGAFQGSFSVLALFLNARFQVTEQTIGYFFMYVGSISVFTRVLLLGRMVDWLGEAKLSRLGLVLLAAGVLGMPLSRNLPMLAIAVALIPLGTAFTFPCVTSLLSRVIAPRERGLYMGMQQTYGGVARIIAPLFFGWCLIPSVCPHLTSSRRHLSLRRCFWVLDWIVMERARLPRLRADADKKHNQPQMNADKHRFEKREFNNLIYVQSGMRACPLRLNDIHQAGRTILRSATDKRGFSRMVCASPRHRVLRC